MNLVTRVGQNFGWATHEGPCDEDCERFTDPIAYYGRSGDEPYAAGRPGHGAFHEARHLVE